MDKVRQPWIYSVFVDGLFILSPPFISLLLIVIFPGYFNETNEISTLSWFLLVVLVDVAHVYTTLYRTYLDRNTFRLQKSLFIYVPFFAWVVGVVLYSIEGMVFWRVLAYLAVYHFIRQQYGFLRIYSRKENFSRIYRIVDEVTVYSATIYPLLFWHFSPDRKFNWFIEGDFLQFKSEVLVFVFTVVFFIITAVYIGKELVCIFKNKRLNLPKNLIIFGTLISWYFGIVHFNGDLIFTLFNVVSHGIPYMALVWIYGRKKYSSEQSLKANFLNLIFSNIGIVVFVLIVLILAFIEEGIWDAAIWNEHRSIFSYFHFIPQISDKYLLAFVVPLLSLPQITHYVLDGFIWKINKDKFNWKDKTLSS